MKQIDAIHAANFTYCENHGFDAKQDDPHLWYATAQRLTREESHLPAAFAFMFAAEAMRLEPVPDIEKITRWEMAASRQFDNAEAEGVFLSDRSK